MQQVVQQACLQLEIQSSCILSVCNAACLWLISYLAIQACMTCCQLKPILIARDKYVEDNIYHRELRITIIDSTLDNSCKLGRSLCWADSMHDEDSCKLMKRPLNKDELG